MRTIGANIRYYRCLHHLTQEKLAELADINEKSISAYENDTRIPPIFTLLEIAQALGVTMDDYMSNINEKYKILIEQAGTGTLLSS